MDNGTQSVRAGRHTVHLHRPDKVLFPKGEGGDEVTKADLVAYYRAVAPFMLPHLRGRPLMLERLPDGVGGPRFVQKDTPDHYPEWVTRAEVPKKEGGSLRHTVCDNTATLLHLADQACLTLHRFLSRAGHLDFPDRLVFDLDPPEAASGAGSGSGSGDDFDAVRAAAHLLGERLDQVGLPSAPMTTGSRGLHIVVPLDGRHDVDDVRAFAKDLADGLVAAHPDELTTAARKKDRGERLYLDVQRNGYAQTAVAPYAVRARPGAPVATPLAWAQLDEPGMGARRWSVADAVEQARTNPWEGLLSRGRALGPARRRLRALGV
ncbi:non-homologous end-joining DNA ligase [Streptomyces sp. NPDC059009]|uniref:non-homologous end-joining DNA ligase n=1 Tax=Streptomyces sp. NPDC059009 TaxID=3346694 RepID=UPI0036759EF9